MSPWRRLFRPAVSATVVYDSRVQTKTSPCFLSAQLFLSPFHSVIDSLWVGDPGRVSIYSRVSGESSVDQLDLCDGPSSGQTPNSTQSLETSTV